MTARAAERPLLPLMAYVGLAYGLTWAWTIPLAVSGQVVEQGRGWPTHYPALWGPALAAVALTAATQGGPGLRDLGRRVVRWRVSPRWWLVALSPLAFLAVGLLALLLSGQDLPAAAEFAVFSGTPAAGVLGVLAFITLGNALGEEVGWRGYALPALQRRFEPLTATLLLAAVWFAWHVPFFWLLATYRGFGPLQGAGMMLGLACGAVVLTWLYNRSGGSILLVVVWHALYNLASGTGGADGVPQAVVTALVMVLGIRLAVRHVRARRLGLPSPLAPPGPARPAPAPVAVTPGGGRS